MNKYKALHIIKESGLIAEKMTDEEKKAKRKARRDARKAEDRRSHLFHDEQERWNH